MAKSPHTTNPSDEGNTIREMVYDLESDICSLEGYSSLLQLAADGVMQHHSKEAGDGLIQLATDTEACVERLREWHRKAHKALGGQEEDEPAKPAEPTKGTAEPAGKEWTPDPDASRWSRLYGRWLAMKAEWADEPEDEERCNQLTEDEAGIVLAMVATPAPKRFIAQKLEVLDDVVFRDRPSSWVDRRDELLLTSIKADVKAID